MENDLSPVRFTKTPGHDLPGMDDGWEVRAVGVEDGEAFDNLPAVVDTETLADSLIAILQQSHGSTPSEHDSYKPDAEGYCLVRMVVACQGEDGPDFYFCKLRVLAADRDSGVCYDAAKSQADSEGYGGPMVAYDETDAAGDALLPLFQWEAASVITVTDAPAEEEDDE